MNTAYDQSRDSFFKYNSQIKEIRQNTLSIRRISFIVNRKERICYTDITFIQVNTRKGKGR
ncbi:hypothetical protein APU01nite_16770 [Alkalibacterium putridalgicola]|uniref:Uncharacterized protein n=1 Tax=Alkalibacterium putridalgicola TaxID=426703 RepID=A0ABQ0UYM2_9LACT|nr:hypothetical protein APU01nite_16770 [Alkalibacterium putridalgicola]